MKNEKSEKNKLLSYANYVSNAAMHDSSYNEMIERASVYITFVLSVVMSWLGYRHAWCSILLSGGLMIGLYLQMWLTSKARWNLLQILLYKYTGSSEYRYGEDIAASLRTSKIVNTSNAIIHPIVYTNIIVFIIIAIQGAK